MLSVGQKILHLRKGMRLTQAELAKKANVKPVTVSKWELDTSKPKGESLILLSHLFNVPIDVLVNHVTPIKRLREQVSIPYFSKVKAAAGGGVLCDNEESDLYTVDKSFISNHKNTIAIKINGDSMAPVFTDESIIFIDQDQKSVKDGDVYVFIHDDMLRMKILENTPFGYRLRSYNHCYPVEDANTSNSSIIIIGRVIAQIQKY
ncbi:XRE family transcriptional regulator [uncultured Vibrio sp.]|uniref:XRE family transcriptional regulator n=1 Tax=uncultured Vibrio sp. TaxID=114054 RepID=UPI00262009C2|nr:XRE family transcriptional regulator [uncultured Vibrio sp.]